MSLNIDSLKVSLKTSRGKIFPVDEISFAVNPGKLVALVGESGCGKTVSALSILRLIPPTVAQIESGHVLWKGKDIASMTALELCSLRGREIGMIFQEPMSALNPVMKIGRQIDENLKVHFPQMSVTDRRRRVVEWLAKVGISDPDSRYENFPHQLSGGMRQRVMIAMAMVCEPELLIADEPTTSLDVSLQAQIMVLLAELQKSMGLGVLLITHDLGMVRQVADEVVVMYAGKVVERASTTDLFNSPLHPYTRKLAGSLPRLYLEKGATIPALEGIDGTVPDFLSLTGGCRFAGRCSLRKPECELSEPVLEQKTLYHEVSCFEVPRVG